jgi:hypothetical protein
MELTKKETILPDVPHDGTLGLVLHDMQGSVIFPETKDTTFASIWDDIVETWQNCVADYEAEPGDFYNAWNYLDMHPAFWKFRYGPADRNTLPLEKRLHVHNLEHEYGIHRCVDIMIWKGLDDDTREIETVVGIELGQYSWPEEFNEDDPNSGDKNYHDYRLDCYGKTVEEAILRAAHNVWEVYGNDRRVCDAPYDDMSYITVLDSEYFDELMKDRSDGDEVNDKVRRFNERLNEILKQATGDGKPREKKAGK